MHRWPRLRPTVGEVHAERVAMNERHLGIGVVIELRTLLRPMQCTRARGNPRQMPSAVRKLSGHFSIVPSAWPVQSFALIASPMTPPETFEPAPARSSCRFIVTLAVAAHVSQQRRRGVGSSEIRCGVSSCKRFGSMRDQRQPAVVSTYTPVRLRSEPRQLQNRAGPKGRSRRQTGLSPVISKPQQQTDKDRACRHLQRH